jgi:hypothetical protein
LIPNARINRLGSRAPSGSRRSRRWR